MIPQMTSAILNEVHAVHPEIRSMGDPFVGSGTNLTEAMRTGLEFWGVDVNPLAILLCHAKSGPFFEQAMENKILEINSRIAGDRRRKIDISFSGIDKWFTEEVQIELSRIRRAIKAEDSVWARRFLWVALAETVRLSSNSRTSTHKLHIRAADELAQRTVSPRNIFARIVSRNLEQLREQSQFLRKQGFIKNGRYSKKVRLDLSDVRNTGHCKTQCDLIVTSPPYGDNATTVAYGQCSFLPLQWIDLCDIDGDATSDFLRSTHEIDSRSLGGSRRVSESEFQVLRDSSPTFRDLERSLRDVPADRLKRLGSYFRDLNSSLPAIFDSISPGGLMVWVLGNRHVGGKRVPLDKILLELLELNGSNLVSTLSRRIPTKRMALSNSISDTMTAETILVLRRSAVNG